jgi:hypothetical protein
MPPCSRRWTTTSRSRRRVRVRRHGRLPPPYPARPFRGGRTETGGGGTKKKTVEKPVQYPRTRDRVISAPGCPASAPCLARARRRSRCLRRSLWQLPHPPCSDSLSFRTGQATPVTGSPLLNNHVTVSTVAVATATDRSRPRRAGALGRACSGPVSLFGAIASTSDRRRPGRCSRPAGCRCSNRSPERAPSPPPGVATGHRPASAAERSAPRD